jgi:GH15 family glucan-1,4-alpha-glucosidase
MSTAIADHALLSDRHSSALVDRSGSVEWLSFPRFDSPSVFGRLLGEDAGHWSITPSGNWIRRWCWKPRSPHQRVWCSPICSHSGPTMADIGSAAMCRTSSYDASHVRPARFR